MKEFNSLDSLGMKVRRLIDKIHEKFDNKPKRKLKLWHNYRALWMSLRYEASCLLSTEESGFIRKFAEIR